MKIVQRWLSFALLSVLLSCGSQSAQISVADIELTKLDGTLTSISAASQELPLLVSLWAVWCQPCKRELPVLQDISRQREDLAILAVNIGDDPETITSFLVENGLSIPVVIDNNGALLEALDAATVPVTVLFDTDGKILWSHLGVVSADQVNEALDTFTSP
jgi:thioredoxin-like negative regulator of GroEL